MPAVIGEEGASRLKRGPDVDEGWGWRFIDLAELGVNSRWSYCITLLRVILYHLAVPALGILAWAMFSHLKPLPPALRLFVLFSSIIAAGIAVIQGVVRTHCRPWRSLISVQLAVDWRRLAIGGGAQGILTAVALILEHALVGAPWHSKAPLLLLILTFVLTPAQSVSEEILFRGYLTQALFIASVSLSLVSLRDDRLELAIGAHTANNWLSIGSIDPLIYGSSPFQISWPSLAIAIVNGILFYGLARFSVQHLNIQRPSGIW